MGALPLTPRADVPPEGLFGVPASRLFPSGVAGGKTAGAGGAGGGGAGLRLLKNPIILLLLEDYTCCQPQAVGADHQTSGFPSNPQPNIETHPQHDLTNHEQAYS